jgi:hypothetical protein
MDTGRARQSDPDYSGLIARAALLLFRGSVIDEPPVDALN